MPLRSPSSRVVLRRVTTPVPTCDASSQVHPSQDVAGPQEKATLSVAGLSPLASQETRPISE